jgi:hypothetical protein
MTEQDRENVRAQLVARLGEKVSAAELGEWISTTFAGVEAYRENDDLVLRSGTDRYLMVRRLGPDRFKVSENVAVPSTSLLDIGGGVERDIDGLIDEIAAFAAG